MRVLGKPELSNAIRLNELEILMSNFTQVTPQQKESMDGDRPLTKQSREEKAEKKSKKRK